MVSVCTGAFALAAAGLLDGRRATTHWHDAADLAARYPRVRVDPDVLWVEEGQVLTSAGVAAGIDLCLHLVRTDHGAEAAVQIARRMVVAPTATAGRPSGCNAPFHHPGKDSPRPARGRCNTSPSHCLSPTSPSTPGGRRAPSPATSSTKPG